MKDSVYLRNFIYNQIWNTGLLHLEKILIYISVIMELTKSPEILCLIR